MEVYFFDVIYMIFLLYCYVVSDDVTIAFRNFELEEGKTDTDEEKALGYCIFS